MLASSSWLYLGLYTLFALYANTRWWADHTAAEDGFSRSHGLFTLSTSRISPSMVSFCDRRLMFPSQQRV